MPELPEVQVVINYLNSQVINKKILAVDIKLAKLLKNISAQAFTKKVINRKIKSIARRAKYLIFTLDDGSVILSHLRMEGKYIIDNEKLNLKKHDHIIYHLTNKMFLKYNDSRQFGTIEWFESIAQASKSASLKKLGIEPFDSNFNGTYLYGLLQKSTKKLKTFLLDQTKVVGIGNIYANEICYAVGLLPSIAANKVSLQDANNIVKVTKKILQDSIKYNGTTIHSFSFNKWEIGSYQKMLKIHQQKICKQCKHKVIFIKLNGRGTFYCPKCQKDKQ